MHRKIFPGLLTIALFVVGCDQSRAIATNLNRVTGYLNSVGAFVDGQVSAGQMSPSTGFAIVTDLQQLNRLNGDLINTAQDYLRPDGKLALTGNGQQKLVLIVGSARGLVSNRLRDPEFSKLTNEQRQAIESNLKTIDTLLQLTLETIKAAKLIKGEK